MSRYIANLIKQGEHQQLDFKHSISDSRKIARTLAAFANTDGGTILVGVKDNGNISGVNSEEEYYMLEGAAQLYCKPEVKFSAIRWDINSKVVLEVLVKSDPKNLYKAQDKNAKWKVFFRVKDENFIATPLQVKVWNAIRYRKSIRFSLSHKDQVLIEYLKEHKRITVEEYCRVGFLPRKDAEEVLVNLAVMGIVKFKLSCENECFDFTPSAL